ncbi:MAG TPA: TAT-variant-translocated molybdopterin oxidoreductase [Rhodothermales bacterium]|nr:TAT-variant-translocated molybdopterin oxidoreductase [Rhodothermales bacterium]
MARSSIDLASVRKRLARTDGRMFWRGLEEAAGTAAFREYLEREFPRGASEWGSGLDRRQFLKLMGASMALAGLTGCVREPEEEILPYVHPTAALDPGRPLYFATAMPFGGYGRGVLVVSHMGRPTKVEGNPDHPASLGTTDPFMQASVLTLYDPERSQVIRNGEAVVTWDRFVSFMGGALRSMRARRGAGLRILTGNITSPSLLEQLGRIQAAYPEARVHAYEPAYSEEPGTPARYQFDRADVILSLDSDFVYGIPASIPYARAYMSRRLVREDRAAVNRLYVAESSPSNTGVIADHRFVVRPSQMRLFARAVANSVGGNGGVTGGLDARLQRAAEIVGRDLAAHRGSSLVVAGGRQVAEVHALARSMNEALGNVGRTVTYPSTPQGLTPSMDSLRQLVAEMAAGHVEQLVILGRNPVYDAPADLEFLKHLKRVPLRIHMGLYEDETSEHCQWHIPESHYLESWGDVRAFDGTASIIQPLIAPLYDSHTAAELCTVFLGDPARTAYEIVRAYWQERLGEESFEAAWQEALRKGVLPEQVSSTGSAETAVPVDSTAAPRDSTTRSQRGQAEAPRNGTAQEEGPGQGLEIQFKPDPTVWDGSFSSNPWLQELPKPITTLTWTNAALIAPATAEEYDVQNGDIVELAFRGRSVEAPVLVLPGQAPDTVTVHLGYGRERGGRLAAGLGFNAYALRTTDALWFGTGLQMRKTGGHIEMPVTQQHHTMEGGDQVRVGTLEEFEENPAFAQEVIGLPLVNETLYPEYSYPGYKWGMAIDLNTCIGCNACVVACQAENNIPVVGIEGVRRQREMHWIRVDAYYEGDLDEPDLYVEPVPCMHCEKAPCEVVCPVGATVHDSEGLNLMVYNRCIGTRYCSNNCPYKVRRFNFFDYTAGKPETYRMVRNPEVTVRSRGVMEKCTYCIQRIAAHKILAEEEDRRVRDGELETACQQACPTEAIVFGDLNDETSRVNRLKQSPLNYAMLGDLNTQPRTTYLARVTNPNPQLDRRKEVGSTE